MVCELSKDSIDYAIVAKNGDYTLMLFRQPSEEEDIIYEYGYAIVNGYKKGIGWLNNLKIFDCGEYNKSGNTNEQALAKAVDYFRMKTEKDYIPRCRLEELASQFKDGLIEDDKESALEYFNNICKMTDREKEFFGIEED